MKIDRLAFLGLVTAVTAAACVVTSSEDDGDGGQAGAGNTSQGGTGNTSQGGSGNTSQGGSGGTSQGGSGGTVETGGSGGEGGGACDDSIGNPAECTTVPVDCEPYCQAAHNNLKPFVAELAVNCLASATGYCSEGYDCFGSALMYACYDSTADDDCDTAVAACTYESITTDDCHAMIDGLTDDARAEVMTCVNQGCSFGLWSCVEGVAFWM